MINLNEKSIGIWYLQTLPDQDFMGHLGWEDGKLIFTHRFRYYKDDLIGFQSKDDKHWYRTDMTKVGVEGAIQFVDRMLEKLVESGAKSKPDKILMKNGDPNSIIQEMKTRPWAHMQTVEGAEA